MTISRRTSMLILPLYACTAIMLSTGMARADMYQYTDQSGTLHLTNERAAVPADTRKNVKIVREEPKPKARPATSDPADTAVQHPQAPVGDNLPATPSPPPPPPLSPVKLAAVVAGVIGALFLMTRLTRSLSSPQLARVIYVAFFLGTFVLGYKLYAEHLVNGYFTIKTKILALYAKAQQREELIPPKPRGSDTEP